MALFALDHNYPEPIIESARSYLPSVDLVPLEVVDERLPDFSDDWRILLALHHHERPWDGMITNDAAILNQATELAVLAYTQLTLVAPVAAGHDPVRSSGLLLAHIENIANRTTPKRPQVWRLAGRAPQGQHPEVYLDRLAKQVGVSSSNLRKEAEPAAPTLKRNPLK